MERMGKLMQFCDELDKRVPDLASAWMILLSKVARSPIRSFGTRTKSHDPGLPRCVDLRLDVHARLSV